LWNSGHFRNTCYILIEATSSAMNQETDSEEKLEEGIKEEIRQILELLNMASNIAAEEKN